MRCCPLKKTDSNIIRERADIREMTKKAIEEKLIDGISEILSVDRSSVVSDVPFKELGLDSLGFVEMLVFIEKTFNLNMVETDLTKKDFETLNSLATFLSNKL